ncbi:DUF3320 domain-containing protein [Magnetospirillum fulvum]|uniref:AAA domain-containing protein n=1 Tax=Magnetospirillum fulvum TaxID=1082 RepID=A0A1H6HIG2_MAGFU|nr:DUF3320 domain-containing protein [Magnetospirillum fulvum]SEH33968.1 AAA domain-containing protein [Magnetospirillum fulvum]
MGDDSGIGAAAVRIEAAVMPRLNLAFHHNSVPFLHELVIVNETEAPLQEVELVLSSDPAFLASRVWHIDAIGPGGRHVLTELDVALDPGLLTRLTEAEPAEIHLVLRAAGAEVATLARAIELLPRTQWTGLDHVPEMVTAFVQPNDPAIDPLLKQTAELLRRNGRDGALNGYEGEPARAWELASALWSAVAALGLDYSLPPAGFEKSGQKVRGPGQVIDVRLATCLDSTLLFCAALEQLHLNPLLVFTKGHVFAGLWLRPEEFTTSVIDDITSLRKRIKLDEMLVFETTLVAQRPVATFGQAVERGSRLLSEAETDNFILAVDVRRARLQRIRPLASADGVAGSLGEPVAFEDPREVPFEAAPVLASDRSWAADVVPTTPQGRLARWQRKLLDLSLRNSLLNFKVGKKAIRLVTPDPGGLEDLLADNRRIRLLPHPDLMEGNDPRSRMIHETRHHEDARRAHAIDALSRDQVLVELSADDLDGRLTELYRQARSTLQEGGANTLFLAYGFLVWNRKEDETKSYRAPLILLPVSLERKSVRSGFSLVLHEDEPRFNPTLVEMLRVDFSLTLPFADGDLPKDEHGLDIDGIWRAVEQAVKEDRGWEVAEEVVLSSFSFAKHLMWKDLVERTDQLRQNPVVRHLLDSPRDPYPGDHRFADPRTLDRTHGPEQVFCPLPADSSQLSAVMAAAKGKDFVLIGPPGTGKSQTIANLIAQCLAERKTVLFVSEKIAALDVVYRRLREVGLGDFCLELHSSKARKLDVLDQLRTAWEAKGVLNAEEWAREARRLRSLRDELNLYVEHLHRDYRNGLTPRTAIGLVLAGRERPRLGLSWPSLDAHNRDQREDLAAMAGRLDILAAQVGGIKDSPLAPIVHGTWSPLWQQRLLAAAEAVPQAATALDQALAAFRAATSLPEFPLNRMGREAIRALADLLPRAAGHDWRFLFRPDARALIESLRDGLSLLARHREFFTTLPVPWPGEVTGAVRRAGDLLRRHHEITAQLGLPIGTSLVDNDPEALKTGWDQAAGSWWLKRKLGQRKVAKAVLALVPPGREVPPAEDLDRLVALVGIERDLAALVPRIEESGIAWAGLATTPGIVDESVRFNAVLAAVQQRQGWTEDGLDSVAEGACGFALAKGLDRLRRLRTLESEIAGFDDLTAHTNGLWSGLRSRPDEIAAALAFHTDLDTILPRLAATAEALGTLKSGLERLLGDGNALLAAAGPAAQAGTALILALDRFEETLATFATEAGAPLPDERPMGLAELCRAIAPLGPRLKDWCAWRGARAEAITVGLGPLVEGIESGAVAEGQVRAAFETDYARWWLDLVIEEDAVLRQFSSALHEDRIQAFRDLDDHFTTLTRDYLRANLCAGLPDIDSSDVPSDWGLLRREMHKQRNHLPLRMLLQGLTEALPRLTPCLLMSPLSIAQYLAADAPPFDVVVFDEASQIAVWDAIGAIARGRQVVMVGDPKQLPPTDFFARGQSDEEEDGDTDPDMESILDECMGACLPTLDLSWHYRSRHESLIAFSNHRYYGGSLVTFPSPVTDDRAVSFQFVENGVYEKGGARTNPAEAKALVADLVRHLKDPDFVAAERTIGVVTFNAEQQKLIEDLLDRERRLDPSLDPFFAEDALEPVMVKNLENVQGDERDLIYFSITYGPDRTGAVSMNFGPMNKSGGGRRLNVAVTRARHALKVFSTLHPDQIDLSRTQAEGVRDLKHFLEFAQRGPRALGEAVMGSIGGFESPFEKMVAESLAARGWRVHSQIGVSSNFRIDLGIVDPDAPGRYLVGIECDGATYHRAATARDRDKLRESVLRGLGWEIVRIWSTDWWVDSQGALDKVDARLNVLLEQARTRRAEAKTAEVEPTPQLAEAASLVRPRAADDLFVGQDFALTPSGGARRAEPDPTSEAASRFSEADPTQVARPNPDLFFDLEYDSTLRAMIRLVIEAEGPVRDDVLARRIARAHGWTRTGSRIQERVSRLARQDGAFVAEGEATFVWPKDSDPSCFPAFRRPSGDQLRPVDEIALPELVALAREVQATGRDGEAALTAMARLAGLHQLRHASRERLTQAWTRMETEG